MASTYSPSLRLELIGTGEQSGLWGDTTNNNLGALLEQAITGVLPVPITDDPAGYTLSNLNGSTDEARNAVVIITSVAALTGSRNVFIPAEDKLYVFKNSTTGGQNIVVKTSGGTGITVPNGMTMPIYCDGTNCYQQLTYTDSQTLNTPALTTPTMSNPTMTGIPVAPTAALGTNTTQVATTAFVTNAFNNSFPSGTRIMFAQAAAPTGWTQITDDSSNNRMLRVVNSTGAGTGGSASPILNNVVPAHTHNYSGGTSGQSNDHAHYTSGTTAGMNQSNPHSHGVYDPGHLHHIRHGGTSGGEYPAGWAGLGTTITTEGAFTNIGIYNTDINHSHNWGNWSGGVNADHSHTYSGTTDSGSSQTNWAPRYIDMILCSKN